MRDALMENVPESSGRQRLSRRVLRTAVWTARTIGWILIALAILNGLPITALNRMEGSVRVISSVVLGFLGLGWVIAVELFLRFFDRYLSRN